jgi:hypothetical protein
MLVIGCTVEEPEITRVPLSGVIDGTGEPSEGAALGEPPLEQAARSSAPATVIGSAREYRRGYFKAEILRICTLVHPQAAGRDLTDPHPGIKAALSP